MENKDERPKKRNLKQLNGRYQQRISVARQGQEAAEKGDVFNTIKYYNMYLKILADVKDVPEAQLHPKLLESDTNLSELMLLSHIYWELTKIYDLSPKLEAEFHLCINKFVEFTMNRKYQIVNAEMLRKYIQKGRHKHKAEFESAYKRIFQSSSKCFISTYCFGNEHSVTISLRQFKSLLVEFPLGLKFVRFYYNHSPKIVKFMRTRPLVAKYLVPLLFRPILRIVNFCFQFILVLSNSIKNQNRH